MEICTTVPVHFNKDYKEVGDLLAVLWCVDFWRPSSPSPACMPFVISSLAILAGRPDRGPRDAQEATSAVFFVQRGSQVVTVP